MLRNLKGQYSSYQVKNLEEDEGREWQERTAAIVVLRANPWTRGRIDSFSTWRRQGRKTPIQLKDLTDCRNSGHEKEWKKEEGDRELLFLSWVWMFWAVTNVELNTWHKFRGLTVKSSCLVRVSVRFKTSSCIRASGSSNARTTIGTTLVANTSAPTCITYVFYPIEVHHSTVFKAKEKYIPKKDCRCDRKETLHRYRKKWV